MNHVRTAAIALLATAAVVPGTVASAAPALACGDRVEGTVVLTHDLVCTEGNGLVLAGSTVLDLAGHRLVGPGAGSGAALLADEHAFVPSVTVRGGTVEGWAEALAGLVEGSIAVADLHVEDVGAGFGHGSLAASVSVTDSTFVDVGTAVSMIDSTVEVTGSRFSGGSRALAVQAWNFATVTLSDTVIEGYDTAVDCDEAVLTTTATTFQDNGTAISASDYCHLRVSGSTFARNDVGVVTQDAGWWLPRPADGQVVDSRFVDNGIGVDLDTGLLLRGNRFTGNATAIRSLTELVAPARIERNVLSRNGDAIYALSLAEISRNRVVNNTGHGIHAPLATDLGGNIAHGNGIQPQCTGVVCRRS